MAPAIACGGLDMVANALYLIAVREGQLSLIATLASLYPASTVLLARVVLGERLGRWQQVGVAVGGGGDRADRRQQLTRQDQPPRGER